MSRPTSTKQQHWTAKQWSLFVLMMAGVVALAIFIWPYLSFMTDRDELRQIIRGAGPWAPVVFMFLQMLQVVVAPLPGTVISLAGGYIFETFWSTVYAMIGTTVGFLIVFAVSKRYGRRVLKYFASEEKVAKYDKVASSKGAFAFIAVGFLFPFIPDPVLGYIAGTTPIPTRILMMICILMRLPGTVMTSLVGSQFGQGNYKTVTVLLIGLAITLLLGIIFYKHINDLTDRLYRLAIREQKEDQRYRHELEAIRQKRSQRRRRRIKRAVKHASERVKGSLVDD